LVQLIKIQDFDEVEIQTPKILSITVSLSVISYCCFRESLWLLEK